MAKTRLEARKRRKVRIRQKVKGTDERPRLSVFRSARHIYAQVINDERNQVLVSASTLGKANQEAVAGLKKLEQAKKIGTLVAERCLAKGITQVVFDRNGYRYQGRIKALAAAAREGEGGEGEEGKAEKAGLKF
jgi:large subunit ribosomal protein L18